MNCVFCKENIEDDSLYCDMCGAELKACPACGKPGKGKVCTSCGTPLTTLKAKAEFSTSGADDTACPAPGGADIEPSGAAKSTYRLPDEASAKTAIPQLRLLNKTINIDLKIDDSSILGRETGQYVATFGTFKQVSGRHCRFNYNQVKGWCVTDLGSTNKTRYNNQELAPNIPQPLVDQSFLKIANIECYIRIIPG